MLTLLAVILVAALALAIWVGWIEPRSHRVRRYTVAIPGLAYRLRAVAIGDLQPNIYHWPPERLGALFDKLQAHEQPDLVFWLGDYYNAPTDVAKVYLDDRPDLGSWIARRMPVMEEIAWEMKKLRGRLGDYAVLGNHDWAWSGSETERHLRDVGITVLKDDVAVAYDPETRQTLHVVGYEDISSGRRPNFRRLHDQIPAESPAIALAHSPDTFRMTKTGPSLMLSGHTHGGQVRLPFLGPLVLPLNLCRFDRGWFAEGGRQIYVTTGLGTSLPPLRLLVRPEVVVLDLVPEGEFGGGQDD